MLKINGVHYEESDYLFHKYNHDTTKFEVVRLSDFKMIEITSEDMEHILRGGTNIVGVTYMEATTEQGKDVCINMLSNDFIYKGERVSMSEMADIGFVNGPRMISSLPGSRGIKSAVIDTDDFYLSVEETGQTINYNIRVWIGGYCYAFSSRLEITSVCLQDNSVCLYSITTIHNNDSIRLYDNGIGMFCLDNIGSKAVSKFNGVPISRNAVRRDLLLS